MILVTTMNRTYKLTGNNDESGEYLIQGHPTYCPIPTKLKLYHNIKVGDIIWGDLYRIEEHRYRGWHTSRVVSIEIS